MTKLLTSAFFFLFTAVYGQNVSDYPYIAVAAKTGKLESDQYGLRAILNSKLKAGKYEMISEETDSWPDAAKNDPCGVLKAELVDTSSFPKNKIQVNFRDCSGKTIASLEGKSNIKEFEAGFQDALQSALKNVPAYNPVKSAVIHDAPKPAGAPAPESVKPASSKSHHSSVKSDSSAQVFSNGTVNLKRIAMSENQFILTDPNQAIPYAIFKESTKKDVYRVQLQDGTQTLGYRENGNIVIEKANNEGSFTKEIFTQK